MTSIFVSDLQRALEFYTEKLGFVKTAEFDDGRQLLIWVVPKPAYEVRLSTEIALFAPGQEDPRIGSASRLVFTAEDIVETYRELKSRGVHFSMELTRHNYGEGVGDQKVHAVWAMFAG